MRRRKETNEINNEQKNPTARKRKVNVKEEKRKIEFKKLDLNKINMDKKQILKVGIIGLIVLIGPYFLILIYEVIKIFKNFKKYYSQYTLLPGMSISLCFVIAYLAGHVFGQVSPMIYLSLVVYLLIADLKEDFNENKRYRSYL